MANYKQTDINGESYVRASSINIDTQLEEVPVVTFQEERVINLADGEELKSYLGELRVRIDDFEKEIELYNSDTGDLLGGTMSMAEVYDIIYSFYRNMANERDNPPQVVEDNAIEESVEQTDIAGEV